MDATAWDARYAGTELVWSAGPNQSVAAACAELPAGRAVDLGAGEGRNAIWLAERGWHVVAVDFSQVALDKGRAVAAASADVAERLTWTCADATRWRAEPSYDLTVMAYLQLPPARRRAVVTAAFDSLVPGGTFLLVGHDSANLAEGTGGPQDPDVLYTAEDVLADLTDRPFEAVRAERVERALSGEHRADGIALDCLVRLIRP
ncbi:MAG: class I SAM-dependent methyltransferase [Nocardioides sp.]